LRDAEVTRRWLLGKINKQEINLHDTIFYTYWLGPKTLGVGLAEERYPEIKLISRVHGGDLYEARHYPPYLPYRRKILHSCTSVFAIFRHGKCYLEFFRIKDKRKKKRRKGNF